MGMRGSVHCRLNLRPPLSSSPQNARLSTARPASATTSAPSVRRACTCTRDAATRPVPRALQLPTAPWSAVVLVRQAPWVLWAEGPGPLEKGGVRVRSGALSRENLPCNHPLGFSLGLFCPLGLSPERESRWETLPWGTPGQGRGCDPPPLPFLHLPSLPASAM